MNRKILKSDVDFQLGKLSEKYSSVTLFYNEDNPRPTENVQRAHSLLEGFVDEVRPWSKPRELILLDSRNRRFPIILRTWMKTSAQSVERDEQPFILPRPTVEDLQPPLRMELVSRIGRTVYPIGVADVFKPVCKNGNTFYVGARLTGVLRHLDYRSLQWESTGQRFLLGRREYSGLRLYARSLENVRPLLDEMRKDGIECNSSVDRVERILEFESNLAFLFLLVSAFSLAGGCSALILSLYGTIERRRRDYGMFRTLGASKLLLGFLPIIESAVLSLAGFGVAMAFFHGCSVVINRVFTSQNEGTKGFCQLPLQMQAVAGVVILGLALVCSIVAAFRAFSISPSEAIHHV